MARPRKNPEVTQGKDLRKFAGKAQKTDFSFLHKAFPAEFGDKVFRIINDDEGGARHFEYTNRGWEHVVITSDMVEKDRRLARFMRDKGGEGGSVIRIPVNPNNPSATLYGVLMMKSRQLFEEEERAAVRAETELTERALKSGSNQSGVGGVDTYAANTGDGKTQGFRQDLSSNM